MKKRISLSAIIIFLLCTGLFAQSKDFGIWYAAGGTLPITNYLDFKLEGDIRTFRDASKIHEGFGEAGLYLQTFRFLSVGAGYRLTSKIEKDNKYYLRHKFMLDLRGKASLARFGLSCRLRYERQVKTYINSLNDLSPDNYGRIKLEANYNIRKSKFEPVIYYETFFRIFETTDRHLEKYRLSAGMEYKITKKHKVGISYIFQRDWVPAFIDTNIISLTYDFKI
jgi:hypothetical protein